jgi:hypothetical protein
MKTRIRRPAMLGLVALGALLELAATSQPAQAKDGGSGGIGGGVSVGQYLVKLLGLRKS